MPFPAVHPALDRALINKGYAEPTPVQAAVLEAEHADRDLLVSAQTGSGKTVAFGLAAAPTLLGDKPIFGPGGAPLCLAIAPTRELAMRHDRDDLLSGVDLAGTDDQVADVLKEYNQTYIDVYGHTDSNGSDAYNQTLSERRASAVAGYLTTHGVQSARIGTRGFGETQPIASNDTEAGRAQNRRVEIVIRPN